MKTTFLYFATVFLVLFSTRLQAQGQTPSWQSVAGHPLGASNGTSVFYNTVTQDRAGDIYLAGFFWGTLMFGNQTFTHSGPMPQYADMFIAKLNASGSLYWLKTATGASLQPKGITIDSAGNCYITGSFGNQYDSTVTFGIQTIKAKGGQDIFIAKYNSSGILQWVQPAGGPHAYNQWTPNNFIDDSGVSVATDAQGNSYISGFCTDISYFSNIMFVPPNPQGVTDPKSGFLAKYNASGAEQWVIPSAATNIATDRQGYVYMCTKGVTKYNPLGAMVWQRIEPGLQINAQDLTVDSLGNSYITGSFRDTATFSNGNVFISTNTAEAFTAKYDSSGIMQWVQPLQDFSVGSLSNAFSSSRKITVDTFGNSYITGTFRNSIMTTLGLFSSQGNSFDVFVAKYSPAGNLSGFEKAGGSNIDVSNGIAIDSNNDIIIIGDATDATFGSHYLAGHQSFLARLRFSTVSSVAEAGGLDGFSVYPNPAVSAFTVALPAFSPGAEVKLLDLTGKMVYMQKLTDAATILTLPKLPSGCYLVQVQSNKQVWHRKLVVQ